VTEPKSCISPITGAGSPPVLLPAESAGGVASPFAASDPSALAHDKAIEAAIPAWFGKDDPWQKWDEAEELRQLNPKKAAE
jgi:hypothetical protein